MPMANLNYHFNVEYYKDMAKFKALAERACRKPNPDKDAKDCLINHYKALNNVIISAQLNDQKAQKSSKPPAAHDAPDALYAPDALDSSDRLAPIFTHSFKMKTRYPGLLVGLGAPHESGYGDNEVKLGFTLDYVTGMPVIPGSTIKGILRSAFLRYPGYISERAGLAGEQERELEALLFERQGNVFFDAVIADVELSFPKNGPRTFLSLDSITPHPSPLRDPIPLTMLKVLPGVIFEFRFRIVANEISDAERINELYQGILEDLGAGAKTNAGYGTLALCVPGA